MYILRTILTSILIPILDFGILKGIGNKWRLKSRTMESFFIFTKITIFNYYTAQRRHNKKGQKCFWVLPLPPHTCWTCGAEAERGALGGVQGFHAAGPRRTLQVVEGSRAADRVEADAHGHLVTVGDGRAARHLGHRALCLNLNIIKKISNVVLAICVIISRFLHKRGASHRLIKELDGQSGVASLRVEPFLHRGTSSMTI